ncbi:MAG: flagellar biosynthetic protein FliR [Pseudomonadota bacterium]
MNEFVDAFIGDTQELLSVGFIVFLRIGAILAVLPLFGERSIPQRIRLGIAAAFTAIIAPAVYDDVLRALRADPNLVRLLGAEAITGVAFGLAVRMFIFVLQIAGTIAAQSTSLSQIFGTSGLEPLPAIGHLLVVGGLALAAISGLHVQVVNAVIGTYDVIPPGVLPRPSPSLRTGAWRVSHKPLPSPSP